MLLEFEIRNFEFKLKRLFLTCLLKQDEREVKKLRRKQSNRESARRSRLRKQAECEALSGKVLELQHENQQVKEANRALLARIEELVAKLEQVSSCYAQKQTKGAPNIQPMNPPVSGAKV